MAQGTVYTEGLQVLYRDVARYDKNVKKEMQAGLRLVAEPVAVDARGRAEKFGPRTSSMIRAGSSVGRAVVRQNARRTTGKRPDFGRLLMRTVLIPALEDNQEEVVEGLGRMLDRLATDNGFH